MGLKRLAIFCIILVVLFILVYFMKYSRPAEIEDTLWVREAKTTYICFEYPECYLVRYEKLKLWVKQNDLSPKKVKK